MDFIQRADAFAAKAHAGQKRKYNGQPYIEHPRRVAAMVGQYTKDPVVIAAALLHDTVEDTWVTLADIQTGFGNTMAREHNALEHTVPDLVDWLTDREQPEWNRATRKAWAAGRLSCAPFWAQSIKCCDLIDNTGDIVPHDKGFAKVYLAEKRVLLRSLNNAHQKLHERAWVSLVEAEAALEYENTKPKYIPL